MDKIKERVEQELNELTNRVTKLNCFLLTPGFTNLSKAQQYLLHKQCDCMREYKAILEARLSIWNNNVDTKDLLT